MLIIFLRTAIILILLVIVMRLMGKRQIGEMQPYEFVITLLIAEAACVPMSDVSIPLLYGIASVLAIFIIHQILTLFEQFGQKWKRIISGNPSIVIDRNGLNCRELKKNNLDVEDLIESLRATGTFSLDEVRYAILESNGKISVVKNPEVESNGELPVILIDCGKFSEKNVNLIGSDTDKIKRFLSENGLKNEKNIEVMTVDGSGKVYLQQKNDKFSILKMNIAGDAKW
ncbi:MAG: DUF421 domain-containing protein [Clostridia bacterium]|nr:DUF421 domain-containing protein [Clostridia bacterium]